MVKTFDQSAYADHAYYLLRTLFFVGPFVAGLDKFFHFLTNWNQYLSPVFTNLMPISGSTFMLLVGVIEMAAGLLVLFGLTRIGGYIVGLWLLGIVVNLLTMGAYYDIALRDFGLALAAFSLARLTEAREAGSIPVRSQAERTVEGRPIRAA